MEPAPNGGKRGSPVTIPAPVRLRPFFSYFGGKWRDTPRLPAPKHPTIIEPFAGSAGYALRHYTRDVVLCGRTGRGISHEVVWTSE